VLEFGSMDTLAWMEACFGWAGGLGALVTLVALFYGIWRGLQRSVGRVVGQVPGLLRMPLFYVFASIAFFGLCYWMWQPLPLSLPPEALAPALVIGVLVYFGGLGFVLWGRLALGKLYFVSSSMGAQLFAGHRLVTTGPYALVRHPMYLGILLTGLGGILLYRTWTLVFITLTGTGLVLRARREEQVLTAEFGQVWQDYCRRVPAFFPRMLGLSYKRKKEYSMNHATRTIVAMMGVILATAGIVHGIFEVLQGNTPTGGLIIQAIGDAQQKWLYGTEEAFTVVPNFLVTGILAIVVGVAVLVWSVGFVQTKHGALVFLLLFLLLFLVGGGIAQVVLFLPAWAAATRINRPLDWWRKILPESIRRVLAPLWPVALGIGSVSFLIGLSISITGYVPGVSDPEQILSICWAFVFGGGLGMLLISMVAGFAHDLGTNKQSIPIRKGVV
jgi:protein-S-isoprenylcysteine O-methyltransferase Ste14